MTREEAIRAIGWLKCTTNREDDLEAIDMAIEALSTDAVSREALNGVKFVAIKGDKVEEAYRSGWNGAIECIIENAPSVDAVSRINYTPKPCENANCDCVEVVRCEDCRHRDLFSCPLADNDFQKDEDFCSWGERQET